MAKKSKKQVRRKIPAVYTEASAIASRTVERAERDFNPDYSYVIKDLRRIGTLAGMFFVILIVLSFILA